ncbi:MAG: histidine kinase dimerization/phospho-acceptor domain-containing protein, partial [Gemmatimonadota bacterium]
MPSTQVIGSIAEEIARELASRSHELARHWHDELHGRVAVRPQRTFPSDLLIEHVPAVIQWTAAFLIDGSESVPREAITRLRGLIRLRREQGHRIEELLAELELLGRVLFDALREEIAVREAALSPTDATGLAQRLHRGLSAIATIIGGLYRVDPPDREVDAQDRSVDFIRVLMHELRNPLSAAQAAAQVLEDLGERVTAER